MYDPYTYPYEWCGAQVPIRDWDAADLAAVEAASSLRPAGAEGEETAPAGEEQNVDG